ncbi:MAG: aldo/keto reductase [Elusimicrobia bacterium]|nr:aldo/keto reductase [Elusimicrobiota bacterium]
MSIAGRAGAVGRQWFKSHGMPVIGWSVLGRGYLELKDNPNGFFNLKRKHLERVYDSQVNRARRELIQRFSTSHGVSKTAVAVAAVLGQDLDAFAVIGPKTPEQLSNTCNPFRWFYQKRVSSTGAFKLFPWFSNGRVTGGMP